MPRLMCTVADCIAKQMCLKGWSANECLSIPHHAMTCVEEECHLQAQVASELAGTASTTRFGVGSCGQMGSIYKQYHCTEYHCHLDMLSHHTDQSSETSLCKCFPIAFWEAI